MKQDQKGFVGVSASEAARRLSCHHAQVARLARQGYIGVRRLPGFFVQYDLRDVEAILASSVTPARRGPAAKVRAEADQEERPGRARRARRGSSTEAQVAASAG
jgi:hypothetical protein